LVSGDGASSEPQIALMAEQANDSGK